MELVVITKVCPEYSAEVYKQTLTAWHTGIPGAELVQSTQTPTGTGCCVVLDGDY